MEVEQDVPERLASGVPVGFDRMTPVVGVHLTRQCGDWLYVSRVLEKQYVVTVKTDGAMMRVSIEEVLAEIHDGQVAMVRELGEYVGHETVGGRHEIVEDEETGFRTVEDGVRLCRQTLAEIDVSLVVAGDVRSVVLVEFRLPLAVTVPYSLYRRFKQFAVEYGVDQPEDEYCLSASGRAGHEERRGVYQRQHCRGKRCQSRLYTFFNAPTPPP